jgi:hypothetical protein
MIFIRQMARILLYIRLVVFLAISGFAWSVLGDGRMISRAAVVPTIPDQRAMIQFSNGVERLIIDTSFVGPGTNFAWVVPLPATPKVKEVSTNFFASLNLAYQPELIDAAEFIWVWFLMGGYVVAAGVWASRRKEGSRLSAWFGALFVLFVALVLYSMSLSASSKITGAVPAGSVEVRDRRVVGIYDVATLAGTNGEALFEWLNGNGYITPASALPVISSYAAQGWVFVAATIHRDASAGEESRPHPLCFTFATAKPVYPLRLTGIENTTCSIDLFVFGPDMAEVPGFNVEYCGTPRPTTGPLNRWSDWNPELFGPCRPGDYGIGNPEVCGLAFPALVTTKLVAKLTAKDMQSDAWVDWVQAAPTYPVLITRRVAVDRALDWFVVLLFPGFIVLQVLFPWLKRRTVICGCGLVILLAAGGGYIRYATIQTTPVTYEHGPYLGRSGYRTDLYLLETGLREFADDRTNTSPLTEEECLAGITNEFFVGNTFTGQPLQFEATPGNITLQKMTNRVEVYWYDIQGAAHELIAFPYQN